MNKNITDFLEQDFGTAALYLNYRSTPSLIDGLKNSHRKIVYTMRKLNKKDSIKVSQLAPLVSAETDYLHGEVSLMGAVVTLAQDYTGSNNLPILVPDGNFGTRHVNDASAPRYIFTKPQPYFDSLFKKEDDSNLIVQNFEGAEIEPRFYVPTIPMLLVNGSMGIGMGFTSKILPRSVNNLIKAIELGLDKKKIPDDLFIPSWNGFEGEVIKTGENKWEIKGLASLNKNKLTITELPVSYSLTYYRNILKGLKEKGVINSYKDFSENDKFNFEVTLSDDEVNKDFDKIFDDLKLSSTYTEYVVCLDENNALCEPKDAREIFDHYFKVKIDYLNKRIKSETNRLTKESNDLLEIHNFIQEVIKGSINLKDKRANVEKVLKSKGYKLIDKLLGMPLYSITNEKAEEAKNKYENKLKELEEMKKQTPESLWKEDLKVLKKEIKNG